MMNFKGVWKIVTYCDRNFAGDKNTRNSVTGFCIYIRSCLILWKAQGQKSVTLLLMEAEYVAVSKVCAKIIFIKHLLEFLGVNVECPSRSDATTWERSSAAKTPRIATKQSTLTYALIFYASTLKTGSSK